MSDALDLTVLRNFGIALLIGALAGIDREKKLIQEERVGSGGIRTFVLLALLGAVSGFVAEARNEIAFLAVAAAAVTAVIMTGYVIQTRRQPDSLGLTTELAALAVFLLGALSTLGHPEFAVMLGIVVSVVLAYKEPIHAVVGKLNREDIFAGLKLLVATFIVLPVLPNQPIDPWGAINPYKLWLLVILISGLSLVGYVATRWLGQARGMAVTGITGGLVSSTAVTLTFAKRSRESADPEAGAKAILTGILLAWTIMNIRVVVAVTIVNPALLRLLLVPFVAMGLVSLAFALLFFIGSGAARAGGSHNPDVPLRNPFSLTSAGKFALLFAVVLLAVQLARQYASQAGVYLVAGVAGLTDVDAIALSMADFAREDGLAATAVRAITIAALSNTLVKAGLVVGLGQPALRPRIILVTALTLATGITALFFL